MVSKQELLKLVKTFLPELDANEAIPDIEEKHDEILGIAEVTEELRVMSLFQEKVNLELLQKRSINSVVNAAHVDVNLKNSVVITMLEELTERSLL